MNDLTIVMAVYGQPLMLQKQIDTICAYPDDVLEHLKVFIVDDHGDPPVDEEKAMHLAMFVKEARLYRVDQNIHWNQGGARNLAMQEADGWVAMIDPDMVFDGVVIKRILDAIQKMKRGQNLRFFLKHTDSGRLDNGSPNTHIVHRDDFFKAGGYDEDFAGGKGYSDVMLARCMRGIGIKEKWREDIYAHFHGLRDIPDAMVTSISRSLARNNPLFKRKLRNISGSKAGWKLFANRGNDRIRFKWSRLF